MKLIDFLFHHKRIKGPLSWVDHIPFVKYLILEIKPDLIVELGTHTGNSFCGMLEAVQFADLSAKVFAVDTWLGDMHAGYYLEDVYTDLFQYLSNTYPNASLLRMTFDEALCMFEDKSIDLLHIDGLHTYEAVKHDFESWLPKMKDTGVILFHDTMVKEKDFGVYRLWEKISQNYISYNFEFCNGLGIISMSNDLNDPVNLILQKLNTDALYNVFFENFVFRRICENKRDLYKNKVFNLKKSRFIRLWLFVRKLVGLKKVDL